ncbi:DUF1343 domain-containing protein [Halosquirtibacter xylanolyticus]|uniref:exo-beta-N-acetylmuramidase NamZ family protein n=1 Tax=Halosquirtibacter xylanolyticus TaxID=3374599 RepID=UPI003747B8DB|nr:DUF1343 domain-containing protein [Prolixibacteraceae bacterium]
MIVGIKNNNRYVVPLVICFMFFISSCQGRDKEGIYVGAERFGRYVDALQNQRVAMVVNHTSYVKEKHLVDLLQEKGIKIKRIFAPEHGFRGDHSDGAKIKDGVDLRSGVEIFSLYGKYRKPTKSSMKDIDVCIFDIQDVGCRFYTYISTLFYVMEACAENNVKCIVLDRPNPNGDYVDGPVLDMKYRSFVGIAPIPVVHGCTVGELARMYKGEKWFNLSEKLDLEVIPCLNYTHSLKYIPPIAPSPNLPNYKAIRMYPSLCFFEATTVSIGRGTDFPFQVIGYPNKNYGSYAFTPVSTPHVSKYPKQEGKRCFGEKIRDEQPYDHFTFSYFYQWSQKFSTVDDFVDRPKWLDLLVGDNWVRVALQNKLPIDEWKKKYSSGLSRYKKVRDKYLLYPEK